MNSRERVKIALDHKEPDRVPFDMGGTVITGIQATAYRKLRQYLGLPAAELKIIDILQQLAEVDDDVMERLNKEIKRRTIVMGVFPDEALVVRLVGSVLTEISDEWQVGRRYFSKKSMRKLIEPEMVFVAEPAPL